MQMNMPRSGGASGPVQGLAAARPQAAPPQGPPGGAGPQDPKKLLQAAAQVLQQAVAQFGPQIVMVLKQLLDSASAPPGAGAGGNGPQAPPQGGSPIRPAV